MSLGKFSFCERRRCIFLHFLPFPCPLFYKVASHFFNAHFIVKFCHHDISACKEEWHLECFRYLMSLCVWLCVASCVGLLQFSKLIVLYEDWADKISTGWLECRYRVVGGVHVCQCSFMSVVSALTFLFCILFNWLYDWAAAQKVIDFGRVLKQVASDSVFGAEYKINHQTFNSTVYQVFFLPSSKH